MRFLRVGLAPLAVLFVLAAAACSEPDPPEGPDAPAPELSTTEQPVWVNGDFEADAIGTTPPSGWTLTTNINNGITDTRPSPQTLTSLNLAAGGVNFTQVVGGAAESQTDPDMPVLTTTLRYPKYGQRAARLNSTGIATGLNRNVNTIRQTMTATVGDVDTTDNKVHIRFAIAPILENPAHTYVQQPYYFVRVQNLTKAITIYTDFNISGQTGVPWKSFTNASGNATQYTDWMLVDVAPGDAQLAVGDQVELMVIAAGCSAGGHWGRVYVDAVGSGVPGLFTYASGPQSVNAGSTITYTINYKNGGTTSTTASKIDLVTPPNTTFNSVSLGAACTAPAAGGTGTVSCPLGTLAPGATGSYTLTLNVPAGTAAGTVITNGNYAISATGITPLIGPKVNTTVTSNVQYANVGVTLSDGIAAIGWGQPTTYTLTVNNAGPVAAPSVTVVDTMPAQLTNVTWTCAGTGGGTCAASGSGSINNVVSLPVGAQVVYTINANIIAGSGSGQVVNTATATVGGGLTDPDTNNNTAVDTNSIGNLRTVTLTKTGSISAGTVTSSPASIACGSGCASATGQFLEGSQVNLVASLVSGAIFNGWSGACSGTNTTCTLTMSADRTVGASFTGPTITITGGNNQAANTGNGFFFPLSVQVLDANGNAMSGAVVTFAPPAAGASATLSATTATTNLFGIASVNATANNTAGTYQVSASVPGATPVNFTLTNIGDPTSVVAQSGTPQTTVVTTAFGQALVALVRDNNNQPVGGVTVTFSAPAAGASATLSAASAVTDVNGRASVTATANNIAGSYNVTAAVSGVSPSATFALTNTPGPAANLSLIAPVSRSATVNTSQGTFTAEVTDAFGNPLSGVTLTFTPPASGASVTLSSPTAVTGANGRASVTGTANTVAGSYVVTVSATGLTSASFNVTNNPGAASTLTVVSGTPQSATVGATFAAPLVARVRDAFGNNVPGVSVAFAAPASGASATVPATLTTDAGGLVSATATANATAGSYSVTAAAAGVATPGTFALTNTAGAPAAITVVSGNNQSTAVTTAFAQALVVRVADASNNPISGVTVTFTRPTSGASATLSSTTVTTGANGQAQVTATANAIAGSYSVTAAAAGIATPATFTLTNTPGAATTLTLIAPTTRSATVNTTQGTFTVEITDAQGNVVPGVTVSFSAPASGASATLSAASAVTGANGRASITATANTVAGTYSLTASATGATSQAFTLTNTAGAPATLTLVSGTPQSATVGATFAAPLVARVRDAFGNNIAGATVSFSAPASGASATVPATVTTDAGGLASASATANATAGSYSVTASTSGVAGTLTYALTNNAGAPAAITVVSGNNQSTAVTTAFAQALVVRVADASNNPISGVTVTFTRPTTGASATLSSTTVTTGANGQAQVTATANAIAGSYTVTAAAAGVATPATFTLTNTPGAATTLTLIAPTTRSATVNTTQGTFTVEITDAQGNVVPGVTVSFSAPASGASATLSAASAVTGANGRASITATANTVAGTYSLTASATGATSQAFTLTNNPGTAATVTLVSGNNQSATVSTAFAQPLVVRVRDAFGNNISGVSVAFAAPASGASATLPATVITDAGGLASASATANPTAGAYSVTATAAGVATPVTFSLTNTAGAPAAITVVSGGTQSTAVTTAFAQALVVRVADASNNPISGATVTFTRPTTGASATLSATTVTTGANGQAQVTATANATAGSYSVTAATAGVATPATFALTNTPGPAATLTLIAPTTRSATVGEPLGSFTAEVTDAFGNPVPGATVSFAAPATGATATLSAPSATTGADGRATITATAGTIAGTFSLTASAPGTTPRAFSITTTPAAPAELVLVSGSDQSTTVNTAFAAPLIARVRDAFGNNVAGATVSFTAPASGASAIVTPTVTTDADGLASTPATANTTAGSYNVTAAAAGVTPTVSFALTNNPGAAAALTLIAPTDRTGTVGQPLGSFAARLTDAFGNPVPGATVSFAAPATGATANLSAPTATTRPDGIATITATAGTIAGSFAISASAPGTAPQSFNVTTTPGAPAELALVSGDEQSTTVNTAFPAPLVVRVRDAFGNNVAGATVSFTAPASGATAIVTPTVTTDADGLASTPATAATIAGSYAVAAAVAGVATPVAFALTNTAAAAAAIIVEAGDDQSAEVTSEFAAPLSVRVVDAFNNPVSGATVTYAAPATGASATLSATTVTTDAQGRAQITAAANTITGTYDVTATTTGVTTPAIFDLTNTAGPPAELALVGGSPQSAEVETAFAEPLRVVVRDAHGNVVPGATVAFTAPAAGASAAVPSPITTDADGIAQTTATANSVAGSYQVNATVGGVATPVVFALTNRPAAAASIELVSGDDQSTIVDTLFPQPLRVRIRDRAGNPVPAFSVLFLAPSTSPSAELSSQVVLTDADGYAEITAEADTAAGAYDVVAQLDPNLTVRFSLTNLPDAPAQLRVAPASSPQAATIRAEFVEPLNVQVVDRFGNPISGVTIQFQAPGAGASATLSAPSCVSDATGKCEVIATANTTAGSYVVSATTAGVADQAPIQLSNLAGPPSLVIIDGGDEQATEVDTEFAQALTVLVVDDNGNPAPNAVVTFTASADPVTAILSATSVATGPDGRASVTARASTIAGAHIVTAVVSGASAPVAFHLTNTVGPPAALSAELGTTPQQTQVGTPYPRALSVRVVDRFGNPVPGATVDYTVPATGASGALSAPSAVSDAGGRALVFLTANTVAGTFSAVAQVAGVATPVTFALTNLTGPAHQLALISGDEQSAEVDTVFGAELVVRVTDEFGNPVAGEPVTFTPPTTPATATLSPLTILTDAQGLARTTATASTVTGSYHVTVTSERGATAVTFELTNTAGPPASAVAVPGSTPQSAEVGTAFGAPIAVLVTDRFGNPVPGVVLTFASPSGPGAGLSSGNDTTGPDGVAQVLANADATAGNYQVTVTVPGLASPVVFLLTNTTAASRYIVIDRGAGQKTAATTAFAQPLVFRVLDAFGNPVAGVALNVEMTNTGPGATMTTTSNVSDAGGYVRYDLVANAEVGFFAVTATAADTRGLAFATLEVLAIPTVTTLEVPEEIAVNQKATVTIRVTAQMGIPPGKAELWDDRRNLLTTVDLVAGSAQVEVEPSAIGQLRLLARYPEQSYYAASTSESTTGVIDVSEDDGSLSGTVDCSASGRGGAGGLLPLLLAALVAMRRRRSARGGSGAMHRPLTGHPVSRAMHERSARTAPAGRRLVMLSALCALSALSALSATAAHAQVDVTSRSINRFHAPSPESNWFASDSLEYGGDLGVAVSMTGDFGRQPLTIYEANDEKRTVVVENSLLAHLTASVTLRHRFRISASAPMAVFQNGNDGSYNGEMMPEPHFAFGDMYLAGDYRVLGQPDSALRLAVGLRATLPTGQRTEYMSDSEWAFEPRALVAGGRGRFEFAAGAGAFLRQNTELVEENFGSELRYTAAAGARLLKTHRLLVGAEVIGALSLIGDSSTGSPTEVGGGAHYRFENGWQLGLGATFGVINAVGVPNQRIFLGLAWRPHALQ